MTLFCFFPVQSSIDYFPTLPHFLPLLLFSPNFCLLIFGRPPTREKKMFLLFVLFLQGVDTPKNAFSKDQVKRQLKTSTEVSMRNKAMH